MTESSKVVRLVRRLLGFSAGYNLVGGLAAVAGLVTPLVAAIAMPVSSFVVVVSAARQRTFRTVDTVPIDTVSSDGNPGLPPARP